MFLHHETLLTSDNCINCANVDNHYDKNDIQEYRHSIQNDGECRCINGYTVRLLAFGERIHDCRQECLLAHELKQSMDISPATAMQGVQFSERTG